MLSPLTVGNGGGLTGGGGSTEGVGSAVFAWSGGVVGGAAGLAELAVAAAEATSGA